MAQNIKIGVLYCNFVKLDYTCNIMYKCGFDTKDVVMLERVQMRFIRMVPGLENSFRKRPDRQPWREEY